MDLLDGKVIIVVSGRCPKRARLCASIFLLSPKARQKGFSLRSLTHGFPCNKSVSHRTSHKKHWKILRTAWGTEWKSFLPCHPMVPPAMNRFRTEQGIKSTAQSSPSYCVRDRVKILFALSSWAKSKAGQKDWNGWPDPKGHAQKNGFPWLITGGYTYNRSEPNGLITRLTNTKILNLYHSPQRDLPFNTFLKGNKSFCTLYSF